MQKWILLCPIILFFLGSNYAQTYEVSSPNNQIGLKIDIDETIKLTFSKGQQVILENVVIDLNLVDHKPDLRVRRTTKDSNEGAVLTPLGLEQSFNYSFNAVEIQLTDKRTLEFRAFDNAVSYRWKTSLKKDLTFLTQIYTDIIAPNADIMDFLEDENITWLDDYPLVNTTMIMFFRKIKPSKDVKLPELIKDQEDIKFAIQLFRKTVLHQDDYIKGIEGKTPNWEKDRIAQLDLILIMMAQCEFLNFSSIPVKVSLNEYLEISKDYSTPKSSYFINGILDNLAKEFDKAGLINKIGRGLM
ncbi:MAG: transcription antitermination factor NusB [Bacteroidota bacterium]